MLDTFRKFFGKPDLTIDACADRRAALRQLHDAGQGRFDAVQTIFDLCSITGEFLTQGQGWHLVNACGRF